MLTLESFKEGNLRGLDLFSVCEAWGEKYFRQRDLFHIHKDYVMSFSSTLIMLDYSRSTAVESLGSSGDIMSWLILIVFMLACF